MRIRRRPARQVATRLGKSCSWRPEAEAGLRKGSRCRRWGPPEAETMTGRRRVTGTRRTSW
eukprot:3176959-Pyramimonas_sp.AAC.1